MRSLARFRLFLWCVVLLAVGAGAAPVWSQGFSFGQPQLSVATSADRPTVAPGDVITYTLTFSNSGTGTATGVAISTVLPQGTTFVDATGNGILFGDTIYWSPGSLNPGQSGSFTLRARVNPGVPNGTSLSSAAQISSVEVPVGVPGVAATVTVSTAPPLSPLLVSKQADAASAAPGQALTFTIGVTNNNVVPATNVTLSDPIPAGTTGVSASDGGIIANGVATWSLGTVAGRSTRQVTLRVQVSPNASGTITNAAQASSLEAPTPVSSGSVSVAVNAAPSLTLTETVDKATASPGDILTYTVSFTNNGGAPLNNGSLFNGIPAGTQFVDASNGGQVAGSSVVWAFGSLAPGTGGVVSFRVRVLPDAIPGIQILSQAQLVVLPQGTVISSQPVITTVAPAGVSFAFAKFADRTAARAGDIITYTLNYANLTAATAGGVEILDRLPPGLAFVDAQGNVQVDILTRTLRFAVGELGPHATGSISFRARVDAGVSGGTALVNQATLNAAGLAQPVLSNPVTTTVDLGAFVGTYRLIAGTTPTSITVDPQNKFTVITAASGLGLGAQGSLRPDGSFDVTDTSGRVRFFGRIDPTTRTASVAVQRLGLGSYSIVLQKSPDLAQVPDPFVGTFVGSVTDPQGNGLRVLMTIDPGGNSTFQADLVQLFPTLIRHRSGSYEISPNGLVGVGGRTDGFLQPAGNTLVLVYNYATTGFQGVFQIPLSRR